MKIRKDLVVVALAIFCLTATLFMIKPTLSNPGIGDYDPWADINDDGIVDIFDAIKLSGAFTKSGTPLTKAAIEYDSGWIDITDMCGKYFNITHGLNSTDIIVDITGKTSLDGGTHRKHLGLTSHVSGWSMTYGGLVYDDGSSVVQTSDGGYALAGSTDSFGGSGAVYLVKTDSVGNMLWNKTYGGMSSDAGLCVVQTDDGGYAIAGSTASFGAGGYDVYLVKTDSAGTMLWNRTFGGTKDDEGRSLVQTSDGGYAIAGYTYSSGNPDVFLVRTNSSGATLWSRSYGEASSDMGFCVVQTSDGGYAIAGSAGEGMDGQHNDIYLVKTDVAGGIQWSKTFGIRDYNVGYSVVQTADGGYAVAGMTCNYTDLGPSQYDALLVKTDSTGSPQWNKTYGGTNYDIASTVVQTSDGGYALAGYADYGYVPGPYVSLVKTDSAGNLQWNKTYTGPNWNTGNSVVQTSDGAYAIAGFTYSDAGYYDVYFIKTDTELGLAQTDSTEDTITLYRGETDPYWNFVRVRIWKPKTP